MKPFQYIFGLCIWANIGANSHAYEFSTTDSANISTYRTGASNILSEQKHRYKRRWNPPQLEVPTNVEEKTMIQWVGQYLREHKFSDFDHRKNRLADILTNDHIEGMVKRLDTEALITRFDFKTFMSSFPEPPLEDLHPDVKANCIRDLSTCLRFIYSRAVLNIYLIKVNKGWPKARGKVNEQLSRAGGSALPAARHIYAYPFRGSVEQFTFRATAMYYMCFYALKRQAQLQHFDHSCTTPSLPVHITVSDSEPFACAMLSFCPDPCIPSNPCTAPKTSCSIPPSKNQHFDSLLQNKLNHTCGCEEGTEYIEMTNKCVGDGSQKPVPGRSTGNVGRTSGTETATTRVLPGGSNGNDRGRVESDRVRVMREQMEAWDTSGAGSMTGPSRLHTVLSLLTACVYARLVDA